MYRMDKLTTGIAYGTSAGNAGFWMLQLLDKVSPSQWAAIVTALSARSGPRLVRNFFRHKGVLSNLLTLGMVWLFVCPSNGTLNN